MLRPGGPAIPPCLWKQASRDRPNPANRTFSFHLNPEKAGCRFSMHRWRRPGRARDKIKKELEMMVENWLRCVNVSENESILHPTHAVPRLKTHQPPNGSGFNQQVMNN